jgi:3-hydroxyacyl-CoA dehydrogenase / enoyl-CoA hydratase / 3-hydroxybutyryl-CoA epimerase
MNQDSNTKLGKAVLKQLESGIAIIHLGPSEEKVVTLTPDRLNSLREILDQLRSKKPKGLIITGSNEQMFTAGVDISLIRDVTDASIGEKLAREGQHLYNQIESLPFPTVAAICGPCVGGGCELALACTYRVILSSKSSVIGLPEIKLGILPGFGGTQRLPRLVGLPKALDVILGGKILNPKKANAIGLVDKLANDYQELFTISEKLINQHRVGVSRPRSLVDKVLTSTSIGRSIVKSQSLKAIAKETKGFYPAPIKALECALYGLKHGTKEGYSFEAQELGKLIITPESKALVNLFFLTESAKGLGRSARAQLDDLQVAVIGAGVMGAGIGGVALRNGFSVILRDTTQAAILKGMQHIKSYLSGSKSLTDSDRSALLSKLIGNSDQISSIQDSSVVIEAVFERMDIKKKVLAEVASAVAPGALIASNTSSLSISEIAREIINPERVIGMHFFNPVEKMPLVEIVRGEKTNQAAIALTCALTTKMGKFPIVVEDVPGFLVNRILSPYLVEAAHLLSEGYRVEDIDRAATRFGMPMGPIRLLDEVGLDVATHVSEILSSAYGERMKGPEYAKILSAKNRLGKKNGIGFYRFDGKNSTVCSDLRDVLAITKPIQEANKDLITKRLILSLINEGVRCLDDGVAGKPSKEAAQQVDLGSVMGFGFPPFRGGLLHYASLVGAKSIMDDLITLKDKFGNRFEPALGIVKRATEKRDFYS